MSNLFSFLQYVLHINEYLPLLIFHYGAVVYFLLFAVIFCETGLVVTAIMPGDSLLFAAGAIAAKGSLNINLLIVLLIIAAFLGNVVNYWIGNQFGHLLFKNEKAIFFKRSYLNKTHAYFEKYGAKTIVIARFIPLVRTFAPFIAGMGTMNHFKFMMYNLIGACLWILLLLTVSYWFGNIPAVQRHFSYVMMGIIVLSVMPIFIELVRQKLKVANKF